MESSARLMPGRVSSKSRFTTLDPSNRPWAFWYIIRSVRLKFRLAYLLGLLFAGAPLLFQQDRLPASDPARDNDVQSIYSWLITHSAVQDKLYLIAPETQQSDYPHERCLEIPPDHIADFREIRANFDRHRNTTRKVPESFSTPKPYIILDANVAKELLKSGSLSDSPIIERFPGVQHLLLFSDVSFNERRTVALVHVEWWCGGLCGLSHWIAFEKGSEGVWQTRPWARACPVIASSTFGREKFAGLNPLIVRLAFIGQALDAHCTAPAGCAPGENEIQY